jgi:type IV pilus assembly protein PilY1
MRHLCLLLASLLGAGAVHGATIPNVPPFVSSSAFANVMIDMSVETPMGGAAYADQAGNPPGCTGRSTAGGGEVGACYFPATTYLGIFDPNKCYTYSSDRFNPAARPACPTIPAPANGAAISSTGRR